MPPPVAEWAHRQRLRPLVEDALMLGFEDGRWLGLLWVWLDGAEVQALCTGDHLGEVDFMPLVENGAGRGNDVLWWRPWTNRQACQ